MASLIDTLPEARKVVAHRPRPRAVVSERTWRAIGARIAGGELTLAGLWGDTGAVHMAVLDEAGGVDVLTCACPNGSFPSLAAMHPPALRLERAIRDLYGLEPVGLPDTRPWLDHGRWSVRHPLASAVIPGRREAAGPESILRSAGAMDSGLAPAARPGMTGEKLSPPPYQFLPTEGEHLHQIPVGPVHAGIIEPGHFRFTANGETVVRLEERLGYVHKGIESLMAGASLEVAAQLAARTSGDSTVAYGIAFAQAVEAALEVKVPPRATLLRALMAEIERLANHLGDIGAICNDASFTILHAQCGILRERTLRSAAACFGHRLMMDRVVPGGVAADLAAEGPAQVKTLLREIREKFPGLVELYDNTASLQDRTVTTGILKPELARQYGAGGYVGRASGRGFDARKRPGYAPYDQLTFDVPVFPEGDVNARVWVRIREVEQSLALIDQILQRLPAGPTQAAVAGTGEGLGLVEGFRGDVLAWVRIEKNLVARCYLRDPSWFQWPLLEAVIEGNIVADFPLCNKSFNCSYSGHDL